MDRYMEACKFMFVGLRVELTERVTSQHNQSGVRGPPQSRTSIGGQDMSPAGFLLICQSGNRSVLFGPELGLDFMARET